MKGRFFYYFSFGCALYLFASLSLSCERLSFIEEAPKVPGKIRLSFAPEQFYNSLEERLNNSIAERGEHLSSPCGTKGGSWSDHFNYALPDSNDFILTIRGENGEVAYSGSYGNRPVEIAVEPGSWDIEVLSTLFERANFDTPLFAHYATIVVESGKSVNLSILCSLQSGAVRLTFSHSFLERFGNYNVEVEDLNSVAHYPFHESRYLFVAPGGLTVSLRNSYDYLFLARRVIRESELLTLNLHSSTSSSGGGGDPTESPIAFWQFEVDSSVVVVNEEVVVGERRDGSSMERAILVDELSNFIGAKGVWVTGFIVGTLKGSSISTTPPFDVATNIALGRAPNQGQRELCAAVALAQGEIRNSLNLADNPNNLSREVWVKGSVVESYYGGVGVNPINHFSFGE
ncbi:MAG: DUF6359 domain-containing protein [Bacteroidales bacterium]